jgi:hypothetical protein
MRPEKLYTVGRSAKWRTSRPMVIIVTEASIRSLASAAATRSFRSRLWSIAKVVGPASVAVAAIIISLLSLEDQHQANQATADSNFRQQAELVTFVQQGGGQPHGMIVINNYSEAPVGGAALLTNVILDDNRSFSITIPIGSIPPCSLGRITNPMISNYFGGILFVALSSATSGAVTINSDEFPNNNNYRLTAESMYFTDDNGVYWQHSADGPLATARFPLGSSTSSDAFIIPTGTATSIVAYENGPRSITPSYKQLTNCTQPGG